MEIPEFLYNIKDLNVDEGVTHCGGEDSFLETLTTFAETAGKIADDTEGFWKVLDVRNTTIKVHAMKSMLKIIGVPTLGSFAERLENAGKENDIETLESNMSEFISAYRQLNTALQPLLEISSETQEETDFPPIDKETLYNNYRKIYKHTLNFNYDSIDEIMEELHGYEIPEDELELFNQLKEVIDNFDYELISDLLEEKIS